MASKLLPLRSASGDLLDYIESDKADARPYRYQAHTKTRIRKGKSVTKTTGYTLIPFPPHMDDRPDSVIGMAFVQHLEHGACYALQGVSGSQ